MENEKTSVMTAEKEKKTLEKIFTHSSGSSCKYFPFLQENFFGVFVVIHNDGSLGAQHQRVSLSVFPLQLFEE